MWVDVVLNRPLRKSFLYHVPDHLSASVQCGVYVEVPFGQKRLPGLVTACYNKVEEQEYALKEVLKVLREIPPLSRKMLELLEWSAGYYRSSLGEMVFSALPGGVGVLPRFPEEVVLLASEEECSAYLSQNRRAKKRCELVRKLLDSDGGILCQSLNLSEKRVLKVLRQEKMVRVQERKRVYKKKSSLNLNPLQKEQKKVFQEVSHALQQKRNDVFLLHGVTGSGKTEIYLHLVADVLKGGGSSLILLPEISLSHHHFSRFAGQFGDQVALLHSGVHAGEKTEIWQRAAKGELKIIIGARSALFAPLRNLSLIIVDEEHDTSYKRDESPCFHARDLAVMRGKKENAVVLLGSATPSLESVRNVKEKKYRYLLLTERVQQRPLPRIEVVNLAGAGKGVSHSLLSSQMLNGLKETLERKEQAILFLNRRGRASVLLCSSCKEKVECPHCSISLTVHRNPSVLRCHYCDYQASLFSVCPSCGGKNLLPVGMGTQRLEEVLRRLFPDAKLMRLDSDSAKSAKDGGGRVLLEKFRERKADILIGTQMVTKGHDFPYVTFVGVVLADQLFSFPDFRSSERGYQGIVQVSGRAGRGSGAGRVVVQSYAPEHEAITCAVSGDMHRFYRNELERRKEAGYPPCSRMAVIRFSSGKEPELKQLFKEFLPLFKKKSEAIGVELSGPAPALVLKVADRYRYHLILKSKTLKGIQKGLDIFEEEWNALKGFSGVRMKIDVDPLTLL